MTQGLMAQVAVDLPLKHTSEELYTYSVPSEIENEICVGSLVQVPFGKQDLNGFVINIGNNKPPEKSHFAVKPIYQVLQKNVFDSKFIELAKWMSKYYCTRFGTVLGAAINLDGYNKIIHEVVLLDESVNLNELNQECVFLVEKLLKSRKRQLSYQTLFQKAKFNKNKFYSSLSSLQKKDIIKVVSKVKESRKERNDDDNWKMISDFDDSSSEVLLLNKDQEIAFQKVSSSINNGIYKNYLLHGVTGSGKTEVYLRLIFEVMKKNRNVIYLVPEIYLIPQTYERLSKKFGKGKIAIWHSNLTKSERLESWEKILNQDSNNDPIIILGARSAILTPVKNIGIVIIDESHESSYKQSSQNPRYDTVNVAKMRAELESAVLVLGSATPNVTDFYEAKLNNTLIEMPNRILDLPMPDVEVIDIKNEPVRSKGILTKTLELNIRAALSRKEQVILLLNRRGYASNVFCKACGSSVFCKHCSIPVVYHKNDDQMTCHHCGFSKSYRSYETTKAKCRECGASEFSYLGVGTEQLEEEVKKLFPESNIIRADKDTLKNKDQYIKNWRDFSSGIADILIGTQLVAKGIDLPNVTLVGVIAPDAMLNFPDYIAFEKSFQLLTQVAGRAGRGIKPGKVIIQTYKSEDKVYDLVKNHDFSSFYEYEIAHRKEFLYPPFSSIVRIILQGHSEIEVNKTSKIILDTLKKLAAKFPDDSVEFLGPAPCFFKKVQKKYRYHLICKFIDPDIKQSFLHDFLAIANIPKDVSIILDVDSVNLL